MSAGAALMPESPPPVSLVTLDDVTELRRSVRERISSANATTEQEVLALGDSIQSIVDEARSYEKQVREQLQNVEEDSGIADALAQQSDTITQLSCHLATRLDALQGRATQAEGLCRDILQIGMRISEISMATKVLAFNARMEAARSQDGASFSVIANEMVTLNRHVQSSNTQINEIAARMLELLPEIRRQSSDLLEQTADYQDRLSANAGDVAKGEAVLRRALAEAQHLGQDRIARIVAESNRAAQHLVFQDPVAQDLMRIDTQLSRLEARACGEDIELDAPLQVELGQDLDSCDDMLDEGEFMFL